MKKIQILSILIIFLISCSKKQFFKTMKYSDEYGNQYNELQFSTTSDISRMMDSLEVIFGSPISNGRNFIWKDILYPPWSKDTFSLKIFISDHKKDKFQKQNQTYIFIRVNTMRDVLTIYDLGTITNIDLLDKNSDSFSKIESFFKELIEHTIDEKQKRFPNIAFNTKIITLEEQIDITDSLTIFPHQLVDQKPVLRYHPHLAYPENALKQKLQGLIVVEFIVHEDGNTSNYKIMKSGPPLLNKEALEILSLCVFKPAIYKGKTVKCRWHIPIMYSLNDKNVDIAE